ncbi:hypothetical protein R1flu_019078 [Riccia fluitans]|uniref:Uncharacterized protein n=1 Tax=Riccia fluitans TaxID=41844 RepID=A0ABD1ZI01_9MARC
MFARMRPLLLARHPKTAMTRRSESHASLLKKVLLTRPCPALYPGPCPGDWYHCSLLATPSLIKPTVQKVLPMSLATYVNDKSGPRSQVELFWILAGGSVLRTAPTTTGEPRSAAPSLYCFNPFPPAWERAQRLTGRTRYTKTHQDAVIVQELNIRRVNSARCSPVPTRAGPPVDRIPT